MRSRAMSGRVRPFGQGLCRCHKPRLTEAYPRPVTGQRPRYSARRAISAETAAGTSPSIGSPAAARARISEDETGSGSISKNETRSGRSSSREHGVQPAALDARARRDAEPRELEHALGLLPARNAANSSAPTRNTGSSSRERLERVDRPGERVEPDLGLVERRERELGQELPDATAAVPTCLCPGSSTTRTSSRSSPKCSMPRRASSTWPTCGGSNAPPKTPTAHDATRAPRRRSRRARPCGRRRRGAPPRAPRPRARPRRPGSRPRSGGCGSAAAPAASGGSRGTRAASSSSSTSSGAAGQRAKRACSSSSMPAPVAHETRWTATIRVVLDENGAGSGLRSALLRTTIWGRSSSPAP